MEKIIQRMNLILLFGLICYPFLIYAATYNNPHTKHHTQNTRYSVFTGTPKTLDPARSYSSDETLFTAQIYEPPLQYHFLKRPYTLVPLTLKAMPTISYFNAAGKKLAHNTNPKNIAYTVYDLYLKPNIFYQPHPAFVKDYRQLTQTDLKHIHNIKDFKHTNSRELKAEDYVYQIKRLASPRVQSPIFSLMTKHIIGFEAFEKNLAKASKPGQWLDLRKYLLEGVKVLGPYHYQIKLKGVYPQFLYWLAMPFFAPIPWEADQFYSQLGMKERNLSFDWQPIGTGAYLLSENNPNKEMILTKNPNFHIERFPSEGESTDQDNGYLKFAGQTLPLTDRYVFSLDKESIPRWNKFLQGYYDVSGVGADSFDQAIKIDQNGNPILTPSMKAKGIKLQTSVSPAIFYLGFNMLDKIVGGYSEQQKKLRQAITIAIDYEEFISIFRNGRGVAAMGPIPPAIFGHEKGKKGINNIVYTWNGHKAQRKPLAVAKQLMKEAGYPNGINPKTGKPLLLTYAATGNEPDDKARFNWLRKQFAKLGIKLNIETTQYNQFQKKIRSGNAQLFDWGWMADYPDPENFLFLLYGPNGKVKYGGENASNYENAQFDALFNQIKNLPNGPERQQKIKQALEILRQDAPWVWGLHSIDFKLTHQWNDDGKPNMIANNLLKYKKSDIALRKKLQQQWNQPILWPLWVFIGIIVVLLIPMIIAYTLRQRRSTIKRQK